MNKFLYGAYGFYHFTNSLLTGFYLGQYKYTQCQKQDNTNSNIEDNAQADCSYDKGIYFATGALIGMSNFISMSILGLAFLSTNNTNRSDTSNELGEELSDELRLSDSGDKKLQKSIAMFLGLISGATICNQLLYKECEKLSTKYFPEQDPRPLSVIATINLGINISFVSAIIIEKAIIKPTTRVISRLCNTQTEFSTRS